MCDCLSTCLSCSLQPAQSTVPTAAACTRADCAGPRLQVEAEASIPEKHRFYCPNPRCSAFFVLEGEPAPDSPEYCPGCQSKICTWCRTLWHKGFGCDEYQVGGCSAGGRGW